MNKSQVAEIISLIVNPLIGEVCHQVRFSYGDELILDFGEMSSYNHPKLSYLQKGSWQLCARATDWILYRNGTRIIYSDILENNNKELINQLENKALLRFNTDFSDDRVYINFAFEDGYYFYLQCDLKDDSDLAHFEFFIPNQKVLIFGPKLEWEFKSLDSYFANLVE